MAERSPFREVPSSEWLAENRSGFAIADAFPVSPGHSLIVPFRQIATWWEAERSEQHDLLDLVAEMKRLLDELHHPQGYNVGFNDRAAAGQTVDHLHIHVIPRYDGDVPDPRGGIRHVIPGKGNYLAANLPGAGPGDAGLLGQTALPAHQLFDASQEQGRLRLELLRALIAPDFDRIDLLVSFIMRSGLAIVLPRLSDAVARGAEVRVLTTDYLDVTDPDALATLLDLQESAATQNGRLNVKVWQEPGRSFHPKAYLFRSTTSGRTLGFVGSSNLSRSGIDDGVEWNLSVQNTDELLARFEALWSDSRAKDLDHELLRDYRQRRPIPAALHEPPAVGIEPEPPVQPVAPTEVQREALDALEATRQDGYRAGLVVMATGLGKTWLAAFDSSRPSVRRTLFVAHREEILSQSRDVFRAVRPDAELGLYYGREKQGDADVVFASVQTLSRRLDEFDPDDFDYVVVDEFHHAAAASYRTVIDHFSPDFLLGLTATPNRMDGADLLALCGDNLVFECDLVEGIRREQLVPFHYWGLKDIVDFEPVPWRNGKFDPAALALAVETTDRAQQDLDAWREHGRGPTLGFCCSITHADFMAGFFTKHGVTAIAVHSGPSSAPRTESIEQLRDGAIQVLFTVDVFNEGLDVPAIETVLMLRPTQSPVIFLQQLGRGLRRHEGKERLRVIDFIGNHQSFLSRPRTLLSLGRTTTPTPSQAIQAARSGEFELPPGCAVSYDLEAVDLLASLIRTTGRDLLADYCQDYADENEVRPSAVQAFRAGFNPRTARRQHGHWFGLLRDLDLLSDAERAVVDQLGDVLLSFEKESATKSYKLVTLRALVHDGHLRSGSSVAALAFSAQRLVAADPRLVRDTTSEELPDPAGASPDRWARYWRQWPISHLAGHGDGGLFRLADEQLVPTFEVPPQLGPTFDAMVDELIEWRLAEYLLRPTSTDDGIVCRVGHANGRPIIRIDRKRHPELPEGPTLVFANDEPIEAHLMKVAINVATRPGEQGNALHDLLRGWFGPHAGLPGTHHAVMLRETSRGWELHPQSAQGASDNVLPLFPTYEVACGAFDTPAAAPAAVMSLYPTARERFDAQSEFVAFASGDSMNGGDDPIVHGDPLLFRWTRDTSRSSLVDDRVLVQQSTPDGPAAVLKRLARAEHGWELRSDRPGEAAIPGAADMRVVARMVARLDQREINPLAGQIGEQHTRKQIPELFHDEYNYGKWGSSGHVSHEGHEILNVTLDKEGMVKGAEYVDRFDGPNRFLWTSQNQTRPDSSKGQRVLESPGNGHLVHLWVRASTKSAFTYCGVLIPLSHEGSKPMSVTFRLLTPLSSEMQEQFL